MHQPENAHQGLFALGRCLITPAALAALESAQVEPSALIHRHVTGDWTENNEQDQEANTMALVAVKRIFSSYTVGEQKFFVITESDRSATTILLDHEY